MRIACVAVAALLARPASAGEPNVISRVELRDAGAAVVLTIEGSRPPSFTTFASEVPPRFVVDVAGGELRGVVRDLAPEGGPVAAVRSEQLAGEAATARVAVSFRSALEGAEVSARGNALVVTFPKEAPAVPAALAGTGPRAVREPARARAAPVAAAAPQEVREFGFRQLVDGSRVYVRAGPAPRFAIEEREGSVVLRLDRARVSRANDARPLDTTFFRSAVARVTPRREGATWVLEIALREKVPYRQRIEGDLLAIDFDLPGASAAAAR